MIWEMIQMKHERKNVKKKKDHWWVIPLSGHVHMELESLKKKNEERRNLFDKIMAEVIPQSDEIINPHI